jgi:hypothetical protein
MSDQLPPLAGPAMEQMKGALKAFKKRLILTRLDAESQLSKNPPSTGRGSGIVAIVMPVNYFRLVPNRSEESPRRQSALRASVRNPASTCAGRLHRSRQRRKPNCSRRVERERATNVVLSALGDSTDAHNRGSFAVIPMRRQAGPHLERFKQRVRRIAAPITGTFERRAVSVRLQSALTAVTRRRGARALWYRMTTDLA